MGQEKNLASSIVDRLLDMLSRCQPYEELTNIDSKTKKPARRAMLVPFAVWCLPFQAVAEFMLLYAAFNICHAEKLLPT